MWMSGSISRLYRRLTELAQVYLYAMLNRSNSGRFVDPKAGVIASQMKNPVKLLVGRCFGFAA